MMLEQLARALASADAHAAVETMAEDVTLRVAVHDAPFDGRAAASQILTAVLDGALHDIEAVETIKGSDADGCSPAVTRLPGSRRWAAREPLGRQ